MAKNMFGFEVIAEEKYRSESQKASGYCIHNRKKCDCGAVVTAKQLIQYGKCNSCHEK